MARRILGIVGSYRKDGTIDRLVTETLASAEAAGATTTKIYLTDKHIEFCTNCRQCMQKPGPEFGPCVHHDDMEGILAEWKQCDGLVIGAPVNYYNVTAVTRKFMERLVGFAYWPWGQPSPKMRSSAKDKKAVLITSSAMPAFMGIFLTEARRALKATADTMGAKPIMTIFAGTAAARQLTPPSKKMLEKARKAGQLLAQ